jgi:hypothetical protein
MTVMVQDLTSNYGPVIITSLRRIPEPLDPPAGGRTVLERRAVNFRPHHIGFPLKLR